MYGGHTSFYGIPFLLDGEPMSEEDERRKAQLLENLIRAAILAEGDTRVFKEGQYSTVINADNSVTVRLVGSPAIRGVARAGLVEVNGMLTWPNLRAGVKYHLYLQASRETYYDPSLVNPVASVTKRHTIDFLYLAMLDNTEPGNPTLDISPSGKAIGSNLFEILNDPTDPFGPSLSQTNLTVTNSLQVILSRYQTLYIKQVMKNATRPIILIDNASDQPELASSRELRFSDRRVLGIPLSDEKNASLAGTPPSIFAAINEALTGRLPTPLEGRSDLRTDANAGSFFTVLMTGDRNLAAPTNAKDGQSLKWRFTQNKDGGHKLTLDPVFRRGQDIPEITLSNQPNKTDYLEAIYFGPTKKWDVVRFLRGY